MGLDGIELVMDVEKHFSISIPDKEAEKAHTVGKLVDCVAHILGIDGYDFSIRNKTFELIKSHLLSIDKNLRDFPIMSKVTDNLNVKNRLLVQELENKTKVKFPGIYFKVQNRKGLFVKIKEYFSIEEYIDFETIRWKKFIDVTLAKNLAILIPPVEYKSKYEIYLAIMKITVDKIGVNYSEIGIEKSFTDDLGVD